MPGVVVWEREGRIQGKGREGKGPTASSSLAINGMRLMVSWLKMESALRCVCREYGGLQRPVREGTFRLLRQSSQSHDATVCDDSDCPSSDGQRYAHASFCVISLPFFLTWDRNVRPLRAQPLPEKPMVTQRRFTGGLFSHMPVIV